MPFFVSSYGGEDIALSYLPEHFPCAFRNRNALIGIVRGCTVEYGNSVVIDLFDVMALAHYDDGIVLALDERNVMLQHRSVI